MLVITVHSLGWFAFICIHLHSMSAFFSILIQHFAGVPTSPACLAQRCSTQHGDHRMDSGDSGDCLSKQNRNSQIHYIGRTLRHTAHCGTHLDIVKRSMCLFHCLSLRLVGIGLFMPCYLCLFPSFQHGTFFSQYTSHSHHQVAWYSGCARTLLSAASMAHDVGTWAKTLWNELEWCSDAERYKKVQNSKNDLSSAELYWLIPSCTRAVSLR